MFFFLKNPGINTPPPPEIQLLQTSKVTPYGEGRNSFTHKKTSPPFEKQIQVQEEDETKSLGLFCPLTPCFGAHLQLFCNWICPLLLPTNSTSWVNELGKSLEWRRVILCLCWTVKRVNSHKKLETEPERDLPSHLFVSARDRDTMNLRIWVP